MKVEWLGGPNDGEVFDINIYTGGVFVVLPTADEEDDPVWVPFCFNPARRVMYHLHYPPL